MHRGNLETRRVCMTWIFWKNENGCEGISQDEFPENGVGRRSDRSFRMRTMAISEGSPTHSSRRVVHIFTDTSVVYFRKQQVLF